MYRVFFSVRWIKFSAFLGFLLATQIGASQDTAGELLRLQLSRAFLNIDTNVQHGQGMNGITYGNPGDVWNYPNSLACVVVYTDGKYVFEKRDEETLGKPKIRQAQGSLSAEDLEHLKAILDNDALKKVTTPAVKDLPDDAVALREIESLDAQIHHATVEQHFTTVKRRVKTRAATGMDTYLDNGAPYQKTLNPLLKWVNDLQKKSKSGLKDARPQYCAVMNIG